MNESIVIAQNQIKPVTCSLYAHTCAIVDAHHICPKSWFEGVVVDTPMILLCPSCHMNTHAAIDGTIEGHDVSLLPPRCVKLALIALDLAAAKGLRPAVTL